MIETIEAPDKLSLAFDNLEYDSSSIPQGILDLEGKQRNSFFRWRGQFSPQLVELLLKNNANNGQVVFDPFVGSGTTLFECARLGFSCYGSEINPAAIEMASLIDFINITPENRKQHLQAAQAFLDNELSNTRIDLFNYLDFTDHTTKFSLQNLLLALQKDDLSGLSRRLVVNSLMKCFDNFNPQNLAKAYQILSQTVEQLPYNENIYKILHADARSVPLPSKSVDLVITSPPYINVFNYHQNNREIMEAVGWNLLQVAKSEIGANRKHRQNRFLTVIQYAMDMADVLVELHRLLKDDGKAILVVGRVSSVRGVNLKNSQLVAALAKGIGYNLQNKQERKLKNKFGEMIYEDILYLTKTSLTGVSTAQLGHAVAYYALSNVLADTALEVQTDIRAALIHMGKVEKSPLFNDNLARK